MGQSTINDRMSSPDKHLMLSNEFKTACAIYELSEIRKVKATLKNLIPELTPYMGKSTVSRMLRWLEVWHITRVTTQFKEGPLVREYGISREDHEAISGMYNRYWKKEP